MDVEDGERLSALVDLLAQLAAGEFHRRAEIIGDGSMLDGIGTGLNMLAEELSERVAHETSLQQRLVRAAQMVAVGQLAAGIAHEINNPAASLLANVSVIDEYVASIRRFVQRARDRLAHDQQALRTFDDVLMETGAEGAICELGDIAAESSEGVRRISSTLRALLGFAQAGSGRCAEIELDPLIAEVCALVRRDVLRRAALGVSLSAVPTVLADRARLAQALTHLMLDAARAIPEGEPERHRVQIGTRFDGARVRLSVCDTGRPIPAAIQGRVFDPVFMCPESGRGAGLALSLAAELVRAQGGELVMSSVAEGETTFEILLEPAAAFGDAPHA
jgi:signal transduction histidine kinase